MRHLIISDLHANLPALDAVLEQAGSFDHCICLGDLTGYGPDPNECIERLRSLPALTCLLGNHDAALLNQIDIVAFNTEASQAIEIHRQLLTPENKGFLAGLSSEEHFNGLRLAHGSPRNPIWEYITSVRSALTNFQSFTERGCLVGHSHYACIFMQDEESFPKFLIPEPDESFLASQRFILNPGSVGQPRDRDPRASYVLWEDESDHFTFKRACYDIPAVQKRILQKGLPARLAERLELGI